MGSTDALKTPPAGFCKEFFYGAGPRIAPFTMVRTMSEDERHELVRTAAEAHSGLNEIAFKLRRELDAKAPALKQVLKAERAAFRLKRELQMLDIQDPEPDPAPREALGDVRRGGKVVDVDRLRRRDKAPG